MMLPARWLAHGIMVLLLALGVATRSQPQTVAPRRTTATLPDGAVAKINTAVVALMTRFNAPGLSLAIGIDGQLRYENGYGLADLENAVPATSSTVYRLASVSKPITAVGAMQLVERRRLALDDTVGKWLPDLPAALRPITVRHLLSHQSGIRHYTPEEDDQTKHYPQHYDSLREALAIFKGDPLVHPPGQKMTYSTYGYTLLGVIMEEASGRRYSDLIRENVFERAGMSNSRTDDVQAIVRDRSRGYAKTKAGDLRNASFLDPSYKIPGGGWLSTAGDMVRFGLAAQAGRLVAPETFRDMTVMQRVNGNEDTFYGLGWIVEGWGTPGAPRVPGLVWHGGVQQGVTTILYMLVPNRIVVVTMTNLESDGLAAALTQLAADVAAISLPR